MMEIQKPETVGNLEEVATGWLTLEAMRRGIEAAGSCQYVCTIPSADEVKARPAEMWSSSLY